MAMRRFMFAFWCLYAVNIRHEINRRKNETFALMWDRTILVQIEHLPHNAAYLVRYFMGKMLFDLHSLVEYLDI